MSVTFHVETGVGIIEELKPLFPLHWAELALNKDQVPLDPQYEVYYDRMAKGQMMFISARELGSIVGYFVGFVAPGLHYKTCLTLQMDIFYIHPRHRSRMLGVKLFRHVEREARRRGVQRMFVGSKVHADASALFKRLGYEPVETFFTRWLGD